jgi:hypothetical protein
MLLLQFTDACAVLIATAAITPITGPATADACFACFYQLAQLLV